MIACDSLILDSLTLDSLILDSLTLDSRDGYPTIFLLTVGFKILMDILQLKAGKFSDSILTDLQKAKDILSLHGAQKIILYGSLATNKYRANSDIDLCVEGLPTENFFPAIAACLMNIDRPVSVIDLANTYGYFKTRLLREGKILYMSLETLEQEINFGLENLEKVYQNILEFAGLDTNKQVKRSALAYECLGYYNAIEHLMIRILKYLDLTLPSGQFSHRETLKIFENVTDRLNVAITPDTLKAIESLMAFRHIATKIYGFLIDDSKLYLVITGIQEHHIQIKAAFTATLESIAQGIAKDKPFTVD